MPEPVAQLRERHAAGRLGELDRRGPRLLERLGRERQVAPRPHRPLLLDERGERRLRPRLAAPAAAAGSRPAGVQRLDGLGRHCRLRRRRGGGGAGAAAGSRRRGGAGSVTVAPATVTCGLVRRTIRRSPAAADTCRRSRSCTSAVRPGRTSERSRRTTLAGASAVPWCTVTTLAVAQAVGGRRQHPQPGVEPVGVRQRPGRGRGVAAPDLGALDADERERDPLARRPPRRRPGRAPGRCARAPRGRRARSPAGRRP